MLTPGVNLPNFFFTLGVSRWGCRRCRPFSPWVLTSKSFLPWGAPPHTPTPCPSMIDIHEKLKFKCDICNEHYSLSYLKIHKRLHIGIKYKCDRCDKICSNKNALKIHSERAHSGNKLPKLSCGLCNKEYQHKYSLKVHIRKTHQDTMEDKHIEK